MPEEPQDLRVLCHGGPGKTAVVLHGGPGAPGSAGGLAKALADSFHVLEPWQRWSSSVPLTVEQHVEDLAGVISQHATGEQTALVGESWGAMLALAFASRYPGRTSALVLVGCGTFDPRARDRFQQTLEQRMTPELNAQLAEIELQVADEGERIAQMHRLSDSIYSYCRVADVEASKGGFDMKGHHESWNDMIRLQESGRYPAEFASIKCPVLMLHGSYDPHPGKMVRDSLAPYIPHLEYQEFDKCGHSPWIEEHARERFLAAARSWLDQHLR